MKDLSDFLLKPFPRAEKSAELIAHPEKVLIHWAEGPCEPGWRRPNPDSEWTTHEVVTEAPAVNNISIFVGPKVGQSQPREPERGPQSQRTPLDTGSRDSRVGLYKGTVTLAQGSRRTLWAERMGSFWLGKERKGKGVPNGGSQQESKRPCQHLARNLCWLVLRAV